MPVTAPAAHPLDESDFFTVDRDWDISMTRASSAHSKSAKIGNPFKADRSA
jgi:hypothetical protein